MLNKLHFNAEIMYHIAGPIIRDIPEHRSLLTRRLDPNFMPGNLKGSRFTTWSNVSISHLINFQKNTCIALPMILLR